MRVIQRIALWSSVVCVCYVATGCATLGKVVRFTDPNTGEVTETTVGDMAADAVEEVGGTLSSIAGRVASVASGNPVAGTGAGAILAALIGAGAARLRRKG